MMYEIIYELLENPNFKNKVKFANKQFAANQKIILQGKLHQYVYLIKSGSVRVSINADSTDRLRLRPGVADLGPNDIFGEFGLFDDLPASADVKTLVDSELLEIDIPSFKKFLEEDPQIGYQIFQGILKTLVKRLRFADNKIVDAYTWGFKANQLDKYLE